MELERLAHEELKELVATIPGLSGRIFKKEAKTRKGVPLQLVGASGLSIADSCS